MERYKHFRVDDFVWDSYFRQWVLAPTRESNTEWSSWISANPKAAEQIEQARQLVLSIKGEEQSLSDAEISEVVARTMEQITMQSPGAVAGSGKRLRIYQRWWFRIAASVLLLLAVGLVLRLTRTQPELLSRNENRNAVAPYAAAGMIEKVNEGKTPLVITLSDDSRITLMKGSRVRYPSAFEASRREVFLTGAAFFDITKDPERPFLVYANELITKVLGTSFLISAYPGSKEVTVEVKTGRVSVFTKADAKKHVTRREMEGVILSPNQKIIFEREEVRMVKTLVEKPEIIVSKSETPHFQFEDTPVSEAFEAIAKAYGIDILYDEELLSECPLTAMLDNQPLSEKLLIICKAVEASYEVVDGQIVIHGKGCKN